MSLIYGQLFSNSKFSETLRNIIAANTIANQATEEKSKQMDQLKKVSRLLNFFI